MNSKLQSSTRYCPKITHTPVQQVLDEYVSATDWPYEKGVHIGKLAPFWLGKFDEFFTNATDELGPEIYYVGCEDGQHTFTNKQGWMQYLQYIKQQ